MTDFAPVEIGSGGDGGPPWLEWAAASLDWITGRLIEDGVCWLRGGVGRPDTAAALVRLLGGEPMRNVFFSSPRSAVAEGTYTATEFSAREHIPPHSEMSYLPAYPRLLCFHALHCPEQGGETTVADLEAVSAELGECVEEFRARHVRYVRVFRDGLDVPMATAFGTEDVAGVERLAREQGMELEPRADGSTRLVHVARGALETDSGRAIWFNQAHLWHPARLPEATRSALLELVGEAGLPRQAFFGDGGVIPDETVRVVDAAFDRHTRPVRWRPGDVVLLDNLRHAHGRRPYQGSRTVHVAMGLPTLASSRGRFPTGG